MATIIPAETNVYDGIVFEPIQLSWSAIGSIIPSEEGLGGLAPSEEGLGGLAPSEEGLGGLAPPSGEQQADIVSMGVEFPYGDQENITIDASPTRVNITGFFSPVNIFTDTFFTTIPSNSSNIYSQPTRVRVNGLFDGHPKEDNVEIISVEGDTTTVYEIPIRVTAEDSAGVKAEANYIYTVLNNFNSSIDFLTRVLPNE